jgi:O-antigen/teichoic acid export membrane protein
LRVSLPVALAIGAAGWVFSGLLSGGKIPPPAFALAAAVGWIAIIPALVSNFWLGQQRRGLMLWLALASAAASLLVSILAPERFLLESVVLSHALPVAVLLFLPRRNPAPERRAMRPHPLWRYVIPGLAIGILSPASMLVARGAVGESLSWHEAGVLQALQRLADWVCVFAAGFLSLTYLPRFAAARSGPELRRLMRESVMTILLPSAAVLLALYLLHRPLLAALYEPGVQASNAAAGLFFAGSLLRVASWIPLFALYAQRRTREITIGEFLSLPLFAVLTTAAGNRLSLELAGAFWVISYGAYCAYNLRMTRKSRI